MREKPGNQSADMSNPACRVVNETLSKFESSVLQLTGRYSKNVKISELIMPVKGVLPYQSLTQMLNNFNGQTCECCRHLKVLLAFDGSVFDQQGYSCHFSVTRRKPPYMSDINASLKLPC